MTDAILVLNAGSSSIKFSVFTARGEALELDVRGQVERLFSAPHFIPRNAQGKVVNEASWHEGDQLSHGGAMEHLRQTEKKR